ncbi:MAG: DnaJ C-terminal domain-containing protein [Candidatus Hodgkinia cicadicola]
MCTTRMQLQTRINMTDAENKRNLTKVIEDNIIKSMRNKLSVNPQNIKSNGDINKSQQLEQTTSECSDFGNSETRKFKCANEYSFALNPLEDSFNDSPLNSKIGKFRGRDIDLIYEVDLEQTCNGDLVNIEFNCEIECAQCHHEENNIKVCKLCGNARRMKGTRRTQLSIPAGVKSGDIVKFKTMGEAGVRGGTAGDLYVKFTLRAHEFYNVRHNSVWCRIPIYTETLTLGGKIDITLPSNVKTTLRLIPTNSHHHEILLNNFGLYESTGCIKGLTIKFEPFPVNGEYIPSADLFKYIDKFNKSLLDKFYRYDHGN